MRMSQELAREIAKKLTETKRQNVEKLDKEFREYVTLAYINTTPAEVLECFKKFPDWFQNPTTIRIHGKGWDYKYVQATETIISNNGNDAYLVTTDKVYAKAKSLSNAHEKEKEGLKQLVREIETALNGLKTFAQIQKHLPEAVPYLPKSSTMELMVNFDTLRSKLAVA